MNCASIFVISVVLTPNFDIHFSTRMVTIMVVAISIVNIDLISLEKQRFITNIYWFLILILSNGVSIKVTKDSKGIGSGERRFVVFL